MRTVRVYQPGDYQLGDLITLTAEAGQHLVAVLRMAIGEQLTLFCGDNREFKALIVAIKKKEVQVEITASKEVNRESPLRLHLAQAVAKGEKMEWVMQKATELGVSSITPLVTEHCAFKLDEQRQAKKWQQWQKIVIGACEQCGRNQLPIVKPFIQLSDYLPRVTSPLRLVLEPTEEKKWQDYQQPVNEITLLIGPEGGLSAKEVQWACQYDFLPLSLGPRILRSETAALSALSLLQALRGDL